MSGRRLVILLGLGLVLTSAVAADDESRYRLPDRPTASSDLAAMLKRRFAQGQDEDRIRKLVEELLKSDAGALRDLQKQLQENPDLRKQVEQKLLAQPELRKTVENVLKEKRPTPDQVRDLVGKVTPPRRPDVPPDRPEVGPRPPTTEPPTPPANPPTPPPPPPSPPPETTPDWVRKQVGDLANSWAKGLRGLDNETLKSIVQQIRQSGLAPDRFALPDWVKDAAGDLKDWLPDLNGATDGLRETFAGWSVPGLGDWTPGVPEMPTGEQVGSSLSWGFLLVLLALAAWGLWQTRGLGFFPPPERDAAGRRLGPWPVAPDQVGTREHVVRCFEYLARKLVGLPAETSHHHAVAQRMEERAPTTAQQQAAHELADLYEHARYAPPDEALSDADLARARQALTLLATVNAA